MYGTLMLAEFTKKNDISTELYQKPYGTDLDPKLFCPLMF